MSDRVQDLTNHRKVAVACKNYVDNKITELKWELGSHTLDVESDTTTAYTKTVPSGAIGCQINKIGGMSYKYNQLVNFDKDAYPYGRTYRDDGLGFTLTINITETSYASPRIHFIQGHKYFIKPVISGTFASCVLWNSSYLQSVNLLNGNQIFTSDTTNTSTIAFRGELSASLLLNVIDLTSIFGAGNEPTDVATATTELLKRGIDINEYQAYDSGSIRDSAVTSVVNRGANLWDEEWEVGSISTTNGTNVISNMQIRAKNQFRITPNTTYYFKGTSTYFNAFYYGINGVFVSYSAQIINNTFTTPNDAYYMRFNLLSAYGTTYNHDIMIVKGSTAPSEYLPYVEPTTYPIASEIQALDGYGWGISEDVCNYEDFENKKFVKMVGGVDLSTLTFVDTGVVSSSGGKIYYATNLTTKKFGITNIISSKFNTTTDSASTMALNTIKGSSDSVYIYVCVNDVSDITGYLVYELATPVETDISEYLDDNSIEVEPLGTLTFTNTYEQAVPSDIDYLIEEVKA